MARLNEAPVPAKSFRRPPMLAKKADGRDLPDHVMAEEKADGMRLDLVCEAPGLVIPYSRSGKTDPYRDNLQHITKAAAGRLHPGESITGELLLNGSWNETMSLVRRKNLRPGDAERMKQVKLLAFDFIDYNQMRDNCYDVTQLDRREELVDRTQGCQCIKPIGSQLIQPDEIRDILKVKLDEGWEGLVLKDPEAPYMAASRSASWLKVKPVDSIEGRIVGFQEGRDSFTGTLGALELESMDKSFKWRVGSGFKLNDRPRIGRHWFWANRSRLMGKVVECFCQLEKKKTAKVRFPIFNRLRPDRS